MAKTTGTEKCSWCPPLSCRRIISGVGRLKGFLLLAVAGIVFVAWGLTASLGTDHPTTPEQETRALQASDMPPGTLGQLRLSAYGHPSNARPPLRHTVVLVNGLTYAGMEDNDVRGFLDGNFKWGWNQVGQIHVRVGRRSSGAAFGEYELFRLLHRWASIPLPPLAQVRRARLRLAVEEGPPFHVTVFLYAVKKDWHPGAGGIHQDNTSPPHIGEVWWNDRAYQQQRWGLPGASFVSDTDPDADVAAMPLAAARYQPGAPFLEFASPALAHYIAASLENNHPLLFLLKLSDAQEDYPGSVVKLYSGNHGDNRNVSRRPHLFLDWEHATGVQEIEREIFLEYGRSYVLPLLPTKGAQWFAATFLLAPGYEMPIIEMRGGTAQHVSPWRRIALPFTAEWDWAEVRVTAARDPVVLGEEFTAALHDTWIRTAPPEDQVVPWTFVSPSGQAFTVPARYQGHYQWQVHFQPQELGRWRYFWTQRFLKKPYRSAEGLFDVVGGNEANLLQHLTQLRDRIRRANVPSSAGRRRAFGRHFTTLERAAMQLQTPESFTSESGRDLRRLLNDLRSLLGGKPVPDPPPLHAMERAW